MLAGHGRVRAIGPQIAGVTGYPDPKLVTATSAAGVMSADIVGAAVRTAGKRVATLEFVWTDAGGAQDPVGQCGIGCSNEYDPDKNASVTFTTYTLSSGDQTGMAPATTSGRWTMKIFLTGEEWIRPFYTRTSGTGTLTCTVTVQD